MIAVIPGLNRTSEACKKKFNILFKQYRIDKLANGVSGSDRKECKFYEAFDQWWHQTGTISKHVTSTASDTTPVQASQDSDEGGNKEQNSATTTSSSQKQAKKTFQDQTLGMFTQMVENSTIMVKNFEKTNALLEKVEHQMDRLIDKL